MKINLKPKNDYLLLQAMEENEMSKGGILIPGAHRKLLNQGIILEIGPDVMVDSHNITQEGGPTRNYTKGEIVGFPQHTEFLIEDNDEGTAYYLVRATDIIWGDNGEAQSEGGEKLESLKLNKRRTKCICPDAKNNVFSTDCPLHPPLPSETKSKRRSPVGRCICNMDEQDSSSNPNCPIHGDEGNKR